MKSYHKKRALTRIEEESRDYGETRDYSVAHIHTSVHSTTVQSDREKGAHKTIESSESESENRTE